MSEQPEKEAWDVLSALAAQEPEEEEEEIPVDVVMGEAAATAGGGRKIGAKVPLDQAKNLKKLREARDGVRDGSLDKDGYRALVEEPYQVAQVAVEIFKSPQVKTRTAGLPADQLALIEQSHRQCEKLLAAVEQMYSYLRSGKVDDVEGGFAAAEAAMAAIAGLQDKAIEKAQAEE